MLSVVVVGAGLSIRGLVCHSSLPRALVLHVALLDEPVECGVHDKFSAPSVEPSGQPGFEQLLDGVRPSLGVVAFEGDWLPALLIAASDWTVELLALLVHLGPGLLRLSVHAGEVLH